MNTPDPARLQYALLELLVQRGYISSAAVEAAFGAVPRHVFLPSLSPEQAYRDDAIPIKSLDGRLLSSSSQPAIMAIMLEQLRPEPGQRVLEIGAGSGYNAALLAYLVGQHGHVVTVELEHDLAAAAREHLLAAGYAGVQVVQGDGMAGYAPGAPYDRIMLTASGDDIVPAWWQQLAPGGRLVMPLRVFDELQLCVAFVRDGDVLSSTAVDSCGFVPLRGTAISSQAADAIEPRGKARRLRMLRMLPLPSRMGIGLRNWLAFGSVSPDRLRIRAHPRTAAYTPGAGELVLERGYSRFVLSRPAS